MTNVILTIIGIYVIISLLLFCVCALVNGIASLDKLTTKDMLVFSFGWPLHVLRNRIKGF